MLTKHKTSICFPAYNEQENIGKVIQETLAYVRKKPYDWEIIIVDDASTDNTVQIVKDFSKKEPRIKLINHKINTGYTGAMNTALKNATGDIIFFIDSDRQYKISEIDEFIDKINQGYDLVVCQRKKISDTKLRILLSKFYNFIFKLLFRIDEEDVDCGVRAFKKKCAKQVRFFYNPVGAELFVKANRLGWNVARVKVTHLRRVAGKSHFNTFKLPLKLSKILGQTLKLRIETIKKPVFSKL
jgi:dolichol-phosphate mannosyltransferase